MTFQKSQTRHLLYPDGEGTVIMVRMAGAETEAHESDLTIVT